MKLPISRIRNGAARLLLLTGGLLLLPSCASLSYYGQSIGGHFSMMAKTRPVEQVLSDVNVPERTRDRLKLAQAVREFAVAEMGLPDNGSYRSYADLGRPHAVWTVIATPEFSVQPEPQCFLFVGCLTYRGYFDQRDAEAQAARLAAQGMDVYVSGATAYSTLGWFEDPLTNAMLEHSEAQLAYVLFHELAHQQLYVKGDSTFNEAFATAVGYEGLRRWYDKQNDADGYAAYRRNGARRDAFNALLIATRQRLARIYAEPLPEATRREAKQAAFAQLQRDYEQFKAEWGGYRGFDGWMARDLNNAHLAMVATYNEYVPAFLALLERHGGDLPAFYAAAAQLGKLASSERKTRLGTLAASTDLP